MKKLLKIFVIGLLVVWVIVNSSRTQKQDKINLEYTQQQLQEHKTKNKIK